MPHIVENRTTGFITGAGLVNIPLGQSVNEFECKVPLATTEHEALGKFFKVEAITGIEAIVAEMTLMGASTPVLKAISNWKDTFEITMISNVREETVESMEANAFKRYTRIIGNFNDELAVGGERSAQEQTEYPVSINVREITVIDGGEEVLYINAIEDIYRVNGRSLLDNI
jgi:phage tail tube protein FII